MPRGVPKSGFRNRKSLARRVGELNALPIDIEPVQTETDEEIDVRIRERFEILADLTNATVSGDSRALIVSGPPGLGKSYTVENILSNLDEYYYTVIKGFVRATGLYRILYEYRNKGQVIVFDDADSIFFDDAALSLLKAACDTTERRIISWRAETNMKLDDGDSLPTSFEFEGSVVFITNMDFDRIVDNQAKFHEHVAAMISRAHFVDLTMRSRRDYLVRIKQVIGQGMLRDRLTQPQVTQVVDFIEENMDSLRELPLRMAIKIASTMKSNPEKWERICRMTCMR